MGRRYSSELLELDATYEWAVQTQITKLSESISRIAHRPLISVGSGGSLTTAHFVEHLHGRFTGQPTQALTPYELVTAPHQFGDLAVLLCSAGGSNPDVIFAAQEILKRAPFQLFAITTKPDSPLQSRLEEAEWPRCHAFTTPTRRDGFLATNSLLASLVLLTRAYEVWAGVPSCLPETLDQLIHPGLSRPNFIEHFHMKVAPVVEKATLVVLYGAGTKPAAIDIESRFTEAALAAIQPSDFRNFAHGRHHWLAKHGATTGVITICQEGDQTAHRTLELLPTTIPSCQLSVEPGIRGVLAAVCQSIFLAQVAGTVKGFDPGRPQVPTFGRKLYHLRAMPTLYPGANEAQERMNLAIERKSGCSIANLEIRGRLSQWTSDYLNFVNRLAKAHIRSVVIDYDGTLCSPEKRFDGPTAAIAKRINLILEAGFLVAIATGRGKSVREALLKHITNSENQSRLFIGYHNGAEIAPLSDGSFPPRDQPLTPELAMIAKSLRASTEITRYAKVLEKGKQVSLEIHPGADIASLAREADRVIRLHRDYGAKLVTSSHSLDIIAPSVSKINVINYIVRQLGLTDGGADSILCIGDRGRIPGNDADLLAHSLSLSVDEVSEDPFTCWNIAQPGLRFDTACLEYLTRLRPGKSGMRFDLKGVNQ